MLFQLIIGVGVFVAVVVLLVLVYVRRWLIFQNKIFDLVVQDLVALIDERDFKHAPRHCLHF